LDYYEDGGIKEEVIWEGEENFAMMQQRLLADFAQAILLGHEPKTNLEQAYIVRKLVDSIYESALLGQSIPFHAHVSLIGEELPMNMNVDAQLFMRQLIYR
ncbi:MAG: hypothetical protein K0R67_2389, partial [Paenibacillus sp.]|nr:hypothetical protein [Paenibacillus sp.]